MEKTKRTTAVVRVTEKMLQDLAEQFAKTACYGKCHEPEMPEQLRQED